MHLPQSTNGRRYSTSERAEQFGSTEGLNLLWPIIILLSAAAAGLVNFVFPDIAIRPIIVFWFLVVCPGMAVIRFLRLKEPVVEWTLAIALSFAIDALVASSQLYAGKWSPPVTLSIVIGISSIGALVQLVRYKVLSTIPMSRPT